MWSSRKRRHVDISRGTGEVEKEYQVHPKPDQTVKKKRHTMYILILWIVSPRNLLPLLYIIAHNAADRLSSANSPPLLNWHTCRTPSTALANVGSANHVSFQSHWLIADQFLFLVSGPSQSHIPKSCAFLCFVRPSSVMSTRLPCALQRDIKSTSTPPVRFIKYVIVFLLTKFTQSFCPFTTHSAQILA